AEEAAALKTTMTPLGAIKGPNADGSIPAWTGGITTPPAGYVPGKVHVDPFGADKPLFEITAANLSQYASMLSPGQQAMFKRYPNTWKIKVYPTRRSAAYPQAIYDAAIADATTAELTADGNGVTN